MIVIGALDVGGAETHLAQVLPRLVADGFEIAVHTLTGRGALASPLEAAGVRVVAPPGSEAGAKAGGFVGRGLRALRAGLSLARFMREWRPDVVHFFLPESYLVGAPIALLTSNAKRVMSRRSLNDYQTKHPLLAKLERVLHKRMDALLGNSAAVTAQLIDEGAARDRVHLIRNGIDLARFATPKPVPRPTDNVVIACVANLIPYKGHADLIDALAQVPREPAWELWCAGRDDGIGAKLTAQAHAAGIGDRVKLLGARNDVPDLLAAADLAVLASHEEGFPNAVLEAMASRRAVIGTQAGGIPEAIADGKTGLIVKPRGPAALAEALARLIADAPLRAAMGDAGRARIEAEFSLDACAAAYAAFYRRFTPSEV
ncbi:MAG: glycosyltransferase [Alphaproteobacteria bacterium]|nr:glycosyltransferase [Alphaproteobacteria bacterium]